MIMSHRVRRTTPKREIMAVSLALLFAFCFAAVLSLSTAADQSNPRRHHLLRSTFEQSTEHRPLAPLARLRGGGAGEGADLSAWRSKYAEDCGYYNELGKDAKTILKGKDGDKYSTTSGINLNAKGTEFSITAKKTYETPDARSKATDTVKVRLDSVRGKNSGFLEITPDSQAKIGALTNRECLGADCTVRLSSSSYGRSLNAEAKVSSEKVKGTLSLFGVNEKNIGVLHATAAAGGLSPAPRLRFGGELIADPTSGDLIQHSLGGQYNGPDYTLTGALEGQNSLRASVYKAVGDDTAVAASGRYNLKTGRYSGEVGVEYIVDANSAVGSRLDAQGNVGVSVRHKLAPNIEVCAAAETNLHTLSQKPKTGMQIKIGSFI